MSFAHFSSRGFRNSMRVDSVNYIESRDDNFMRECFVATIMDGPSWSRRTHLLPVDGGLLDVEEQFFSPNPDLFVSLADHEINRRTLYINTEATIRTSEVASSRTRIDFRDGTSVYVDVPFQTVTATLEGGLSPTFHRSPSEAKTERFLV